MDQGATWYGGRPWPGHIVLDGDPTPPTERGTAATAISPHFSAHFALARLPISATVELLYFISVHCVKYGIQNADSIIRLTTKVREVFATAISLVLAGDKITSTFTTAVHHVQLSIKLQCSAARQLK